MKLPFSDRQFTTLYADPPWPEYGGGVIKRGADHHYSLLSVAEIAALGGEVIRVTAESSHLYLWTTNNYLPAALHVVEAWGFYYKTLITWVKDRFGLGQYFRGQTEHCIFAVRGNIPYRTRPDGKRAQGTTLLTAPRGEHSVKPESLRDMIELVSPGPYLELFARPRPSLFQGTAWAYWGDEAEKEKP